MHLEVPVPDDLRPYVTRGEFSWAECFSDLTSTVAHVAAAGFEIVHAEYATTWWDEFARHDPFAKADASTPAAGPASVIARKPALTGT
jgi:hypothetical protein